jgi:glycosyltransferase involved in cell wall biosynthesis
MELCVMGKVRTIIYVHPGNGLYGADVIILAIIRCLDRQVYRPIVVLPIDLPYPGMLETELNMLDVKTYHLRMGVLRGKYFNPAGIVRSIFELVYATIKLTFIIHKEQADIIHSNTLSVLCGAFAASFCRKLHIWQVHEFIQRPRIFWILMSWLVPRMSTRVIVVSKSLMDHLRPKPPYSARYRVIYNGVDVIRFSNDAHSRTRVRQEWGIAPNEVLVGMLGRISTNKGQHLFIDAAAKVAITRPQARFVIVGDVFPGFEHLLVDLKKVASNCGLDRVLIWSNFRADASAVMQAIDIYVMPSVIPEGLGLVVLEAMASGKPVIAYARGGYMEAIEPGVSGILVEPDNYEKMATAINLLIDSPDERLRIGNAARDRVVSAFNMNSMISQWLDLYDSLLPN